MMKYLKILISDLKKITYRRMIFDAVAILIISISLIPVISYAETKVYSDDVVVDWVWNREGSPYIIQEPIYIPDGHTLTIGKGVEVSSIKDSENDEYMYLSIEGDLTIDGGDEDAVKISNLHTIDIGSGNTYIHNALLDGVGLVFFDTDSEISSTTVKNSFEGIRATKSRLNITNSFITNNGYGIFSKRHAPIFQVRGNEGEVFGIGGNVNVEDSDLNEEQNIIKISNSVISGNSNFGIFNQTENIIDARNNWWGSAEGPDQKGVSGLVEVEPWMTSDPNVIKSNCCSSVFFIPGIKSSRLNRVKDGIFSTSTDKLWEPHNDRDVKELYMNEDGVSIDSTVFPSEIIDSGFSLGLFMSSTRVYEKFINTMDSLVDEGKIADWEPYAYDWRKTPEDVVDENMIKRITELALNSQTGKVIVIAHSNGGLITKALVEKLKDKNKDNLIEKIVFVAVPEKGTPMAIPAMLHGYDQSLFWGRFPTERIARIFSQNMPGAYTLLPSKEFFVGNTFSVISDLFSENTEHSTYEDMRNFILNNIYSLFSSTNLNMPLKLSSGLLSIAENFHSIYDKWKSPTTTETLSIVGWGLPTIQSVTYSKDEECKKEDNSCILFTPETSVRGDGTVHVESNTGNSDETLFIDLPKIEEDENRSIEHYNILESESVIEKIADVITEENNDQTNNDYEKYFSNTEPVDIEEYLTIRVHSPVDIHVYDGKGNHNGPLDESNPAYAFYDFERNIPGSMYSEFDSRKIVVLPFNEEYKIELNGTDVGEFYIELEIKRGDEKVNYAKFDTLPVTPKMNMELVVATSSSRLGTDSLMKIDIDANGTIDVENRTDEYFESIPEGENIKQQIRLKMLRSNIVTSRLPQKIDNKLVNSTKELRK